jgi:hypothetical protein
VIGVIRIKVAFRSAKGRLAEWTFMREPVYDAVLLLKALFRGAKGDSLRL